MSKAQKPTQLRAVRASAAIDEEYRVALEQFVAAMNRSIDHWLRAAWNAKPPEMAQDADPYRGTPSNVMQRVMKRLAARWTKNIDELAPRLAEHFAKAVWRRSERALKKSLKDAGWTIQFNMTPAMNDVFQATVHENVALIRSIAGQHLSAVEGLVQRAVAAGGDVGALSKQLQESFGVTKRRAALIARDQNSKATTMLQRARQTEIGITEAVWKHSHAGKTPRISHVGFDGETFNVADGVYDNGSELSRAPNGGERIWPGTAINCRCYSRPILPAQLKRIENRAAA